MLVTTPSVVSTVGYGQVTVVAVVTMVVTPPTTFSPGVTAVVSGTHTVVSSVRTTVVGGKVMTPVLVGLCGIGVGTTMTVSS